MNKKAFVKINVVNWFLTPLAVVVLLSGCRTYFGYETREERKDVAGSDRRVSGKILDHDISVDGGMIKITAEQEDIYEKQVEVREIRSHVYLSSTDILDFTPLRWLVDIGHCWTSWHLCSNPPGFTRRLFYAPPFCWFTFCVPPYWFDDPKNLSEGKTLTGTHELDNGRTVKSYTVKTTECETLTHAETAKYPVKSRHLVTNTEAAGEKIRVSAGGKTFELGTDNPVVTRDMLPSFISRSDAIVTDLADVQKDLETKFADFEFSGKVTLTVQYRNSTRECEIDTAAFMTGEELWNCGWSCAAKKDFADGKRYLMLAAEKGYPPAMFYVGGSYLKGDKTLGIEQNVELGISYVKKAAGSGLKEAQYRLGDCYYKGAGVERDYGQAVYWFRQAAEQGYPAAQCGLGKCYAYGRGVELDPKQAKYWFGKVPDGIIEHDIRIDGERVLIEAKMPDDEEPLYRVTDGARSGEKIRVSAGGKTFELGTDNPVVTRDMLPNFISRSDAIVTDLADVQKDLETKFAGFEFRQKVLLTVRYRNTTRECEIDTAAFMTGEELWNCGWSCAAKKNTAGGKRYLMLAAEKGYPPAMFAVGGSCLKGDKSFGIEKNVELGISYVKKAADAGYAEAQNLMDESLMSFSVPEIIGLHSQKLLSPAQFRRWFKAQRPMKLTMPGLKSLCSAGLISARECDDICSEVINVVFIKAYEEHKKESWKDKWKDILNDLKNFGWEPANYWLAAWDRHYIGFQKEYYGMLTRLVDSNILADKYTAVCIILDYDSPIPQCVAGRLCLELKKNQFIASKFQPVMGGFWGNIPLPSRFQRAIALYKVSQRDYHGAMEVYKKIDDYDKDKKIAALRRQMNELHYIVDSPDADMLIRKIKDMYLLKHNMTVAKFCQQHFTDGRWLVKTPPDFCIVEFSGYDADRNLNIIRIKISPDGRFWNIDDWLKTGTVYDPLVNVTVDSSPSRL